MAKVAERNTSTYAYAAHPYSKVTVDVPDISLFLSSSKCESPYTTATIGFFTRDPIGFKGRSLNIYRNGAVMSFTDSLGLYQIPIIERPPGPWTVFDFFDWYLNGGGRAVDLSDIGLLALWVADIQPQLDIKKKEILDELGGVTCDSPTKTINRTIQIKTSSGSGGWFDPLTVMGNSLVNATYSCSASLSCSQCPCYGTTLFPKSLKISCDISYSVRDRFANPSDWNGQNYERDEAAYRRCRTRCHRDYPYWNDWRRRDCFAICEEKYPPSEWSGCTPYDITGKWTDKVSSTTEFECP